MHIKADFTNSATHPAVAAGQLLLYNFLYPTTAANELYVKKVGILTAPGIPFTASSKIAQGWTWLPSGMLLKWGTVAGSGLVTTAFPPGATIPAFTAVLNVQLTINNTAITDIDAAVRLIDYTNLQFRAFVSRRYAAGASELAYRFYYFAIGY